MPDLTIVIERDRLDIPKIVGRGRPIGSGSNLKMLAKMRQGDSVWDIPFKKMQSIRVSASRAGVRIMTRKMPESKNYAVFRL